MPFSCVMLVYNDLTSHVTSKVPAGNASLLLISLIFRRKWLSSLRYDGNFRTSGWSWSSTHLEMLAVAELIVLQIGRAGGGRCGLCIFGTK